MNLANYQLHPETGWEQSRILRQYHFPISSLGSALGSAGSVPRNNCFTAPAMLGELDEAGITELIHEPNRRGETTLRELREVLEPTRRGAGHRAVL